MISITDIKRIRPPFSLGSDEASDMGRWDIAQQWLWSSGLSKAATYQPGVGISKVFSSGSQAGNVQE
jgi:hypothetical protein